MPDVSRLQPKGFASHLDEIARDGARQMLAQALEVEVADYIARNQEREENGRTQVVRNGKASPRKVTLGSGTIEVRAPRVDDRRRDASGERQRFRSQILPPYMRRSPKIAEVTPLYLRGLSTGDFKEGLAALLGDDASGLSPTAITRLTAACRARSGTPPCRCHRGEGRLDHVASLQVERRLSKGRAELLCDGGKESTSCLVSLRNPVPLDGVSSQNRAARECCRTEAVNAVSRRALGSLRPNFVPPCATSK